MFKFRPILMSRCAFLWVPLARRHCASSSANKSLVFLVFFFETLWLTRMKKQREKIHLKRFDVLGWCLDRYGIVPEDSKSVDFEFVTKITPPLHLLPKWPRKSVKIIEKPLNLGTGGQVWPKASFGMLHVLTSKRLLSSYRANGEDASTLSLQGKRMVELGSGTGFISIVCALTLGLSDIVITDLPDLQPHIKRNLYKNKLLVDQEQVHENAEMNVRVEDLDWRQSCDEFGKFDLVVCCDCIYEESCFLPLVSTIAALSREGDEEQEPTIVVIAYEERKIQEDKFWELFGKIFECHSVPLEDESLEGVRIVVAIKRKAS